VDALAAGGADVIIANSHAGLGFGDRVNIPPGKDEHIARHALGPDSGRAVDLIVSGHSHVRLSHPLLLDNAVGGRTGIVQGLEGGMYVTRTDLVVDTETDAVDWVDSVLLQVDAQAGEEPATLDVVERHAEALDARLPERRTPVAQAETFLSSRERTACAMGQLINASFLHALAPAEDLVSFVIPSTYRTDIQPGPIDLDLAYKVLSMHKMDAAGTNEDTIVSIALRPGRYDFELLGLAHTRREGVTGLEYFVETVHSLQDVLGDILPGAGGELSLEVIQFGGMSYVLDATAPPFSRVVADSLIVGGAPPVADRTYRIAGAHSILTTIARVMDTFVLARVPASGEALDSTVVADPETGEPFSDSGRMLYEALHLYLAEEVGAGGSLPDRLTRVTGEAFRTVQPDLTTNPADIQLSPTEARPGERVRALVQVRNLGMTPVRSARVSLWWEKTPWDGADDPDGFGVLRGGSSTGVTSTERLAEQETAVGAWPGTAEVVFEWTVPEDTPAARYPVEVRIEDVRADGEDPHSGVAWEERSTADNAGRQRARLLRVRAP